MTDVSELASHTGYLLRIVSNAVSRSFAHKVASQGVTVAEWAMLRSLYDSDAIAPSTLALKMSMTKGAISKLADRLLEKGLIERASDPDDKRGHRLSLSTDGRTAVPWLAGLADENDAAFFGALSAAELHGLREMLHALIDAHHLSIMPID